MKIILLTAFLTSLLVLFFVILYVRDRIAKHHTASPEQAALLPLQDDANVASKTMKQ